MDSGVPTTPTELAVNTRVFIRGGKSFENILEAYQVMWGEIDGPINHQFPSSSVWLKTLRRRHQERCRRWRD